MIRHRGHDYTDVPKRDGIAAKVAVDEEAEIEAVMDPCVRHEAIASLMHHPDRAVEH